MLNIVILDADTLGNEISLSPLTSLGNTTIHGQTSPQELINKCLGQQVIITNKVVIDRKTMEELHDLKLICVAATGTNNIDLIAARDLGIEVKNVVDYSTYSVAQHNFAMLLGLIHNINKHHQFVMQGDYSKSGIFTSLNWPYFELKGKTYGIIGMGNIGRLVGQIASSFGAKVVYSSLSGALREEKFERVELNVLYETCDIIGIHCPLNEYSKNLIGEHEFKMMKQQPILVNMARGGIVDEQAMATALQNGQIKGACVDVYAVEPAKDDNPLLKLKGEFNFLLSPHVAWASLEARKTLVERIAENIKNWFSLTLD
ncbi:MAG: D-2-hydroxyacid dehydrogenase [Cytophagales bacterium]